MPLALDKENQSLSNSMPQQSSRAGKGKGREEVNDDDDVDMADVDQDSQDNATPVDGGDDEDDSAEAKTKAKRDLRAKYRGLADAVDDTRKNLLDVSVEEMSKQVEQANLLFKSVEAPAEAILDSRVLMAASDAGALKARQLKLDANAFDTDEFITKLLHFMGARPGGRGVRTRGQRGEDEDEEEEVNDDDRWVKVGRTLAHESRRIPAVDHMWGPLSTEVKEKKAKTQRSQFKADESQRVRPEEIDSADVGKDAQETTKMVTAIHNILEQCDVIPYMQFITNPDSFARTVENMFYFAFLVKEGRAAIEVESDTKGQYYGDVICYRCDPADENDAASGTKKHQLIFELTQDVWSAAIKAYDITESAIPTREIPVVDKAKPKKKGGWH